MITASHNLPEDDGFKPDFIISSRTELAASVQQLQFEKQGRVCTGLRHENNLILLDMHPAIGP
jgi:hypothetical protein